MLTLLLALAHGASCEEDVDEVTLVGSLLLAETAFGSGERVDFLQAVREVEALVPCVVAELSTSSIGWLHRVRGLRSHETGDIDAARRSFGSARVASGERFDPGVVPADHPVQDHVEAVDLAELRWLRLPQPAPRVEVFVDGVSGRFLPGLPHLVQVVGDDVTTHLVARDEPFPEYPREDQVEPDAPIRRLRGLVPGLAIGAGVIGVTSLVAGRLHLRSLRNRPASTSEEEQTLQARMARTRRRSNLIGVGGVATGGLMVLAWRF